MIVVHIILFGRDSVLLIRGIAYVVVVYFYLKLRVSLVLILSILLKSLIKVFINYLIRYLIKHSSTFSYRPNTPYPPETPVTLSNML